MVGASVVLLNPAAELTVAEDHHPILGHARGRSDGGQVVVEGLDGAAQGPLQVGVVHGLVAVGVPAAEAGEVDLTGQTGGDHLGDELELAAEAGAEGRTAELGDRVGRVTRIGHRGRAGRERAPRAEGGIVLRVVEELARGGRSEVAGVGAGGREGIAPASLQDGGVGHGATAQEVGREDITPAAGDGDEAAGGALQHDGEVRGYREAPQHVAGGAEGRIRKAA